jgi:hypothetical protein
MISTQIQGNNKILSMDLNFMQNIDSDVTLFLLHFTFLFSEKAKRTKKIESKKSNIFRRNQVESHHRELLKSLYTITLPQGKETDR